MGSGVGDYWMLCGVRITGDLMMMLEYLVPRDSGNKTNETTISRFKKLIIGYGSWNIVRSITEAHGPLRPLLSNRSGLIQLGFVR